MGTAYDETNKLWSYFDPQFSQNRDVLVSQRLLESLSTHGSRVAQINSDTGMAMTFDDLRLESIRAAQNLQRRGYRSHQVFGFLAGNSDHLASILIASICLACPIAPMHPMLSKQEIVRFLAKTKPTVIFCDASSWCQLNEALEELNLNVKVFTFGEKVDGLERVEDLLMETGEESSFKPVDYDNEKDIAGIFCSSGTTGPSKYVSISYNADPLWSPPFAPDNIVLCFESIFWTAGVKPIIDSIDNGMKRILTSKSFTPELALKLIEEYSVTLLYIPPLSLVGCLKNSLIHTTDLSSVQAIIFYGCKMPNNFVTETNRHFPDALLINSYGMTEAGIISFSILNSHCNINSGDLYPGTIVKIVDENGKRCGLKINGEICIKKNHHFLGYFDDAVATAAVVDDEGFFHTGDCGHFDASNQLIFEDRKKNFIRPFYFIFNVVPSEIEDYLLTFHDIMEVCVVGIPVTTDTSIPAAVIVRRHGSNMNFRDVYDAVAEKFPIRSRLRGGVYFVDSLPKTFTGKPIRKEIVEIAAQRFKSIKESDPDIQSYLSDIPEEFRKLI